jgi:hypothetical protein
MWWWSGAGSNRRPSAFQGDAAYEDVVASACARWLSADAFKNSMVME